MLERRRATRLAERRDGLVRPRFTGNPLHSRRLAAAQLWLANGGLLVFVTGFFLLPNTMFGTPGRDAVALGGLISGVAAYIFVYNIWRTIDGPPRRVAPPSEVAERGGVTMLRRSASG